MTRLEQSRAQTNIQWIIREDRDFKSLNTAISIDVVGSKLQSYKTKPNGGLGIHWNLHIGEDENYKFLFLCLKPA